MIVEQSDEEEEFDFCEDASIARKTCIKKDSMSLADKWEQYEQAMQDVLDLTPKEGYLQKKSPSFW